MNIFFEHKIEKKMSDQASIKRHYGKLADKIVIRMSILQGAECLDDIPNIPPTRRHKLSGNYSNCWAIDIDKSWRIVLKSPDVNLEDPKDIREVIIVDIVDYH